MLALLFVAVAIAVPVLLHTKPWKPDDPHFQFRHLDNETYPFVSVEELVKLMASEQGVTVLDARETPSTFAVQSGLNRNIPGFARARWTDFMDGDNLKTPEAMAQAYRDRGVMNDRPVVVYGGWAADNFWGEEGRVWWHLYWLNHPNARILYGGIWAWDSKVHKVQRSMCWFTAGPSCCTPF
ncbi:MAG: hypothetical protein HC767_04985 [Akkermansiaceae bacterium]|nr:hypothetical protein [Akkermansiaceae bacterium]